MTLTLFIDAKDVLQNATRNPDTAKDLKRHYLRHLQDFPLTIITIEAGQIINQERISPETT